jgi:aryl-alcohol dehydrogenase-like predicted oxidoreductase
VGWGWLLYQKPWVVPIPGGTKIEHLADNLPAADVVLTSDDIREIDENFAGIDVKGAPLSAALDAAIDR